MENPKLYDVAKKITLEAGMEYRDPRTGETTKPPEKKKKDPPCARCKKDKPTRKHHWPLASSRLVPLCNHCYKVAKNERKRAAKFYGR